MSYHKLFKPFKIDKDLIFLLSSMSSSEELKISEDQIKIIFQNLFILAITQFSSGEDINIPYFGKLNIKYLGDIITEGFKEANIDINLDAHPFLKRIIGQLKNNEITDIENFIIDDSIIPEFENKMK